jgi:hypothetical protein
MSWITKAVFTFPPCLFSIHISTRRVPPHNSHSVSFSSAEIGLSCRLWVTPQHQPPEKRMRAERTQRQAGVKPRPFARKSRIVGGPAYFKEVW